MNSQENKTIIQTSLEMQYMQQQSESPCISIDELLKVTRPEKTKINDIPFDVFQMYIFGHFSTFQLFNLRLVCAQWGDYIKSIWCSRVKDQMLEQVNFQLQFLIFQPQIASLDILYQKETTLKILEYKISHLQQYERMLKNFMNRMNLHAISTHLLSTMDSDAIMIVLMSAMLIKPEIVVKKFFVDNLLRDAVNYFTSQNVPDDFKRFADMKARPSLSINQIKLLRTEYYNKFASNQAITGLQGNGPVLARVFVTWIDSAIEYTILKHQVRLIRLQYCNVVKAMNSVSSKWPKKKKFIQGAYKLFLFSRETHPLVRQVWKMLNKEGVQQYFDYEKSKEKIVELYKQKKQQQQKVQKPSVGSEEEKGNQQNKIQQEAKITEQQQLKLSTLEKGLQFLKMTQSLKQMVDFVYVKDKRELLRPDTSQENIQKIEEDETNKQSTNLSQPEQQSN